MGRLSAVALVLFVACEGDSDLGWVEFNGSDQAVEVAVTPDAPPGEPVSLVLTSTTGAVDVGTLTVDPGSGPVGTEHLVTVDVVDAFEEDVRRVTLETSGERGTQRHLLERDSADLGLWVVRVASVGVEGEARTDTFTARLWRPAEEGEDGDTAAEDPAEE